MADDERRVLFSFPFRLHAHVWEHNISMQIGRPTVAGVYGAQHRTDSGIERKQASSDGIYYY